MKERGRRDRQRIEEEKGKQKKGGKRRKGGGKEEQSGNGIVSLEVQFSRRPPDVSVHTFLTEGVTF